MLEVNESLKEQIHDTMHITLGIHGLCNVICGEGHEIAISIINIILIIIKGGIIIGTVNDIPVSTMLEMTG